MTILVCYDSNLQSEAEEVSSKLNSLGYSILFDRLIAGETDSALYESERVIAGCLFDMIVSVGGDGTMLRAAQKAVMYDKPVFGINAGRIGFLTAFDFSELNRLTSEDISSLSPNERIVLEISVNGMGDRSFIAVNDAVIGRSRISKTVELEVYSDAQKIGEYRGDGVIVSTPTGSTGYSMSAGGPIIDPTLDVIVVTPICAHTMFVRSAVLNGSKKISVNATGRIDSDVYMSIDSTHMIKLEDNFRIEVYKSSRTLKLLSSAKKDYFDVLNKRIGSVY